MTMGMGVQGLFRPFSGTNLRVFDAVQFGSSSQQFNGSTWHMARLGTSLNAATLCVIASKANPISTISSVRAESRWTREHAVMAE